mgnify:CR=1 FL=1
MDEIWELCTFERSQGMVICAPGVPPKMMGTEDYIKSKGVKPPMLSLKSGFWDVYPYLLTDGWEPFGVMEGNRIAFRRKVRD